MAGTNKFLRTLMDELGKVPQDKLKVFRTELADDEESLGMMSDDLHRYISYVTSLKETVERGMVDMRYSREHLSDEDRKAAIKELAITYYKANILDVLVEFLLKDEFNMWDTKFGLAVREGNMVVKYEKKTDTSIEELWKMLGFKGDN